MQRIMTLSFLVAAVMAVNAGSSQAQTTAAEPGRAAGAYGVGATSMLFGGPSGVQVVYDAGAWHGEGILVLRDPSGGDDTLFGVGGRFWYHLHSTGMSDFSVGGGLGYQHDSGRPESANDQLNLEAGVHVRAFIIPNVALSGTFGLGLAAADYEGFALQGSLLGGLGVTYYFF